MVDGGEVNLWKNTLKNLIFYLDARDIASFTEVVDILLGILYALALVALIKHCLILLLDFSLSSVKLALCETV